MNHSYIDKYADLDSPIHRIHPRIKIILFFGLVLCVTLTGRTAYLSFVIYGTVLFIIAVFSKIPLLAIFKKILAVIPFVVLIAVFIPFFNKENGWIVFSSIVIKACLSIFSMTLLTSVTKFTSLLKGIEGLKVPKIFIMIMSFMYRYLFLLIGELQRMQRAKESRTLLKTNNLNVIKTLSNIIGVLFVRSYERAERVYLAMCSRGFDGEIRTLDE